MTEDTRDGVGYWAPQCPAGAHDDPGFRRDHFDPLSETLTRGRYVRVAGEMAQSCPVTHTDGYKAGIWTVSGYEEIQDVHRAEGTAFSAFPVLLQDLGNTRPVIPMESDPPLHRQYKQIIAPPLSRSAQAAREPAYREVTRTLLDAVLPHGRAELFGQFCTPLAAHSLMEAMGVPGPDRGRLAELAVSLVRGEGADGAAAAEVYDFFGGLAAQRRRAPGEDIVSLLCAATVDDRPLTETEILDYCMILLPAGFETTASTMSFLFLLLAERPDVAERLRAEPARIPDAIEELMRYATPTRSHTRTVTADCVIGGRELRTGERVYLNWAGANHDPRTFPRPDEIDLDRRPNRHMAFGFGSHVCVGMHPARAEMKVALEEALAAMDDLRLTDPADVVETIGTTWAISHLPVTFTPLR
ncbi:cytochrome P450 [Actinomycetospora sp. NBRC 106375]|uniref:cytochrome P450 n=1 Tax=Actinomycetospora sp. NBRC 106375 TaxID=3032207 RepID=UPI0024A4ACF8|nr:cytochrome P450 [Actinomycetospora sp. NBRC 106375]GLZ47934.1 cytochrome P450 [Actinomycetospora sp. NBRC 106375]